MKRSLFVSGLTILSLVAISCSKDEKKAEPENKDLVSYKIQLDVNESNLDTGKLELLKKINAGKEVSFKKITSLSLRDNSLERERSKDSLFNGSFDSSKSQSELAYESLYAQMDELKNEIKGMNYLETKSKYETKIEANLGKTLLYNKDYITLPHILEDGKKQCLSGTEMNLLLNRMRMSGKDYQKENIVAIVKSGHVLPGKMVKIADGQWYLFGIETTGKGDAIIDMGYASLLHYKNEALRVIDSELFVLLRLYKKNFKDSVASTKAMKAALSQTAKKYGIDLEQTEILVEQERLAALRSVGPSVNSSVKYDFTSDMFDFAPSTQAPGDIVPSEVGMTASTALQQIAGIKTAYEASKQGEAQATKMNVMNMDGDICSPKFRGKGYVGYYCNIDPVDTEVNVDKEELDSVRACIEIRWLETNVLIFEKNSDVGGYDDSVINFVRPLVLDGRTREVEYSGNNWDRFTGTCENRKLVVDIVDYNRENTKLEIMISADGNSLSEAVSLNGSLRQEKIYDRHREGPLQRSN